MATVRSGNSLTVRCVYDGGYEDYIKYWCKGENSRSCIIQIKTETHKKEMSKGRFTIKDTPATHSFNVIMVNMSAKDSDIYYCGIERNLVDNMHMMKVEVLPGVCRKSPPWSHIVDFPENFTEIAVNGSVLVSCPQTYGGQMFRLQCRDDSGEFLLSETDGPRTCVDHKMSTLTSQARSLLLSSFGLVVPILLKLAALLVSLVGKISGLLLRRLQIYREELEQRRSLQGGKKQHPEGLKEKKDDISHQREEVHEIYKNVTDESYKMPPKK